MFQCIETRRLPAEATYHTLLETARKHVLQRQYELHKEDLLYLLSNIPTITPEEAELFFSQPGTPEIMVSINAKFGQCHKVLKEILEELDRYLPQQPKS